MPIGFGTKAGEYPEHMAGDQAFEKPDAPAYQTDDKRHRDTVTQLPEMGYVSAEPAVLAVSSTSAVSPVSLMSEFLTGVWEAAMKKPPPARAAEYHVGAMRKLVALCHELQVAAKEEAFFLTCRDAGQLLGITYQQANKWLYKLEKDEVLLRVSTGVFKSDGKGKANEYRWAGG